MIHREEPAVGYQGTAANIRRGGDHGVEIQCRSAVKSNHAVYQRPEVLRTGANMVWNWKAGFPVVFADESALYSKAQPDEPRVADYDGLQAQQFVQLDRPPPRFTYRASPTLDSVLRRTLSFNGVARFGKHFLLLQRRWTYCGSRTDVSPREEKSEYHYLETLVWLISSAVPNTRD